MEWEQRRFFKLCDFSNPGHGEQATVDGGDAMQNADFVFLDGSQNIFRRGAAEKDGAGDAVAQREKQIVTER